MDDDGGENGFVEKRKNCGLSDEQIDLIREAVLASVYEDIGRSLVRKVIWAIGAVLTALLTWFGANHVQIK